MLFAKLLLSPMPHARVTRLDTSAALAMPGVKAILTADDLPGAAAGATLGEGVVRPPRRASAALTKEPLYEGEPILAVAAVDELTAAEAIEKIEIEFEPLPFVVDPLESLRPGSPNARAAGQRRGCVRRRRRRRPARRAANAPRRGAAAAAQPQHRPRSSRAAAAAGWRRTGRWRSAGQARLPGAAGAARTGRRRGAAAAAAAARPAGRGAGRGARTRWPRRSRRRRPPPPQIAELKWTDEDFADGRRRSAADRQGDRRVGVRRRRRRRSRRRTSSSTKRS